ncbi:hypothetical protein NTGHW29_300041 [Candidatus Nitrotoga sp. HW29]|nr:hypothetical protein NTGHW29_300041 [Candidatus Nitrotoga sp. HW29]
MLLACTTCWGTHGNGWKTRGMKITRGLRTTEPLGCWKATGNGVYYAEVAGIAIRGTRALPFVCGLNLQSEITVLVSVLPGRCNKTAGCSFNLNLHLPPLFNIKIALNNNVIYGNRPKKFNLGGDALL